MGNTEAKPSFPTETRPTEKEWAQKTIELEELKSRCDSQTEIIESFEVERSLRRNADHHSFESTLNKFMRECTNRPIYQPFIGNRKCAVAHSDFIHSLVFTIEETRRESLLNRTQVEIK